VAKQLQRLETRLEELYERWIALSERQA